MRVTRVIITGGLDDLWVVFDDRKELMMRVNWKLLKNVHHFAAAVERSFDGRTLECAGRRLSGGWFSAAVEYDQTQWRAEIDHLITREQRPPRRPRIAPGASALLCLLRRSSHGALRGLARRALALRKRWGPSPRRTRHAVKGIE